MSKPRVYSRIDFTNIKPEHVQRIVKDLYGAYQDEKREFLFGQMQDRRQNDRRQQQQAVLLDTRDIRSRRKSAGRRQLDENLDNIHKIGVDYYI